MPRAENEAVVRRIFDAFAQRQGFPLRDVFAGDAVWVVPGDGSMGGAYRGREEILRFLARLPKETDGSYRSELIDVLASETRAAAVYRATGRRGTRTLDLEQVLLFRFEDGRVQEVTALPSNPDVFAAFWA